MAERYNYIDFLRFVGITLIVLAHIQAPFTITQIRIFDVPLMVFVSGLSYSGRTINASWSSFYWPRIKRIIIPVYIFLTFYFILFYVLKLPLTWKVVANSYLLATEGGIGFVWIMRVFLLIMLVTPFLIRVSLKIKVWFYYLILLLVFLINTAIVKIIQTTESILFVTVLIEIVPYLLGYSVIFMLGLRVRNCSKKEERAVLLVVSLMTIMAAILYYVTKGLPFDLALYKYPPSSFFLLYGFFVCIILWALRRYLTLLSNNAFVLFVGRNTIWIYLWHILFVTLSFKLSPSWMVRYFVVYFGAIIIYYLQYRMVKYLMNKYNWNWLSYLIG